MKSDATTGNRTTKTDLSMPPADFQRNAPTETPEIHLRFSEPVDPNTVTTGSIQIREGPQYGLTVAGEFICQDGRVVVGHGGLLVGWRRS